jgi:hypothetical protein
MIHGIPNFLSSARGELQGITAVSIISTLLSQYHNKQVKISSICDNVGVVSKCAKGRFSSLWQNRDANIDLYLMQRDHSCLSQMSLSWVRGHSNKKPWDTFHDLKGLNLSRDGTYNVWCDQLAQKAWVLGQASIFDPSVLPSEQWAVYSRHATFHKLTESFDNGIYSTYGYTALSEYLHQKHNLSPTKMDKVNVLALQSFLSSIKVHKRASIIKMIQNWIPTHNILSQQGCKHFPLCPRCSNAVETSEHVYKCSQSQAMANRHSFLKKFLSSLLAIKTPTYIIRTLEYKLSVTLEIPFLPTFQKQDEIPPFRKTLLLNAIQHQNITGWDNFLRGYTSLYWLYIFQQLHIYDIENLSQTWDKNLVESSINLLQQIWNDRNSHLHGSSKVEATHK